MGDEEISGAHIALDNSDGMDKIESCQIGLDPVQFDKEWYLNVYVVEEGSKATAFHVRKFESSVRDVNAIKNPRMSPKMPVYLLLPF